MMAKKTKLELTWIGKEARPRLEPRVLLEDPSKSYHAAARVTDEDIFDNRLIFGDNLLALKALEQEFTGKIKCIYIDPPYNTGSAFEHYDDGIEHSLWLSMMQDRLELLRTLLRDDGSIWITLDDNESHYLKVMCDEIFGRNNYVSSIVWKKNDSSKPSARHLSVDHDYILIYAKDGNTWKPQLLPRTEKQNAIYTNRDNDSRGPWLGGDLSARNKYSLGVYPITTPSGRVIPGPANGRFWSISKARLEELDADGRIWWGKNGDNVPQIKRFLSEVQQGVVAGTWWDNKDVGSTRESKKEAVALSGDDAFATPKPERLIHRILTVATNPGDIVLDSFAGSGTTGAVAHKMRRKWIMVELGQHCNTHIVPRLKKVIDGQDSGGITETVDWKGGGGFRYYTLAPSLLQQDQFGNWVINKQYNAPMLAQAVCKIEGFTYAPSDSVYWQHGHSTESDFIYVTTQTLTRQQIEALAEDVGPKRSLVIYCHAFRVKNVAEFPNLTLKKIPKTVLTKCEWGKDDYSLEIKELKPAEPEPSSEPPPPRRRRKGSSDQPTLFALEGDKS